MRRRASAAVASLTLVAIVGLGGSAHAVVPGTNGRIVFTRLVFSAGSVPETQVVTSDANGANVTILAAFSTGTLGDEFEIFTNWSPDGKTVIMNVFNAIWEVDADGSDLHELISCSSPGVECGTDGGFGAASFTPDGGHIVTGHCCTDGDGLYRLNADGTGLKAIRTNRGGFGNPQVSPDGRTIAFSSCSDTAPGCAVGTMNINGGNLRMLTDGSVNWDFPNWSPDSKRIVISGFNGGSANIAIMNADGTGFHQLTSDPRTYSVWACFSPDGAKLLFSLSPSTSYWDLYTMSPDGTGARQATRTALYAELWPQWGVA